MNKNPDILSTVGPLAAPAGSLRPYIGRYRVKQLIGQGRIGLVYLACDEYLNQLVAIKVPHLEEVDRYLAQVRAAAGLDHPNIVPVFDVGTTKRFPWFVVSKYIDGTDLRTRLRESRLSIQDTVELVATMAEALHYAHEHGLIHRDIKPCSILLNRRGKPFIHEFGLGGTGNPSYMSPEQLSFDAHLVDGRTDIFSLGVVYYEMLTGRRPFNADTSIELMEQIRNRAAPPPRQFDATIPKKLESVCLKALSKRPSERYTTAKDMANELRQLLRR
jgi:serine/threonine protein kinase